MKVTFIFLTVVIVWMYCCATTSSFKTDERSGRHLLQVDAGRVPKAKSHLVVTSILNRPFLMQKETTNRSPDDRYEGFVVDLLNKLSSRLNFTYQISVVKDGRYGALDTSTGEWNGMIGEVLSGAADIAVADLTTTHLRQTYVDISTPFMTSGIGILMKKPSTPSLKKLFLMPFDSNVWVSGIIAFSVMSALLFLMSRVSSREWVAVPTSSSGSYQRENNLGFCNSLWFALGSLTQQGSRVAPRAIATRILAATWWIFCFFFIACYIANLSAILVHQLEESAHGAAIQNVEDLERQTSVKYGSIRGGSTFAFFKNTQLGLYQRMFAFMESTSPSPYVKNYDEGMERVMQGGYAIFMESASIEYVTERNCEVAQVGGLLDYRGYGIAMAKGSPLLHSLSNAILELQEKGIILVIRAKWWGLEEGSCKAQPKTVFTYPGDITQFTEQGKSIPGSCNAVGSVLHSHGNKSGLNVRVMMSGLPFRCSSCLPCSSGQTSVYLVCLCQREHCASEALPVQTETCSKEIKTGPRGSLSMDSIGGIFVILILGSILALIVGVVELFWKAKQTSKQEGGSLCDEVTRELKFGLCGGSSPTGQGEGLTLQRQDHM